MSRESYTATVDRIVDGEHVVLLLESDDRVVDEVVLPRERAPDLEGGEVVTVVLEGDAVVEMRRDETETDRRRRDLREKFDRLSQRPSESADPDADDLDSEDADVEEPKAEDPAAEEPDTNGPNATDPDADDGSDAEER